MCSFIYSLIYLFICLCVHLIIYSNCFTHYLFLVFFNEVFLFSRETSRSAVCRNFQGENLLELMTDWGLIWWVGLISFIFAQQIAGDQGTTWLPATLEVPPGFSALRFDGRTGGVTFLLFFCGFLMLVKKPMEFIAETCKWLAGLCFISLVCGLWGVFLRKFPWFLSKSESSESNKKWRRQTNHVSRSWRGWAGCDFSWPSLGWI